MAGNTGECCTHPETFAFAKQPILIAMYIYTLCIRRRSIMYKIIGQRITCNKLKGRPGFLQPAPMA